MPFPEKGRQLNQPVNKGIGLDILKLIMWQSDFSVHVTCSFETVKKKPKPSKYVIYTIITNLAK